MKKLILGVSLVLIGLTARAAPEETTTLQEPERLDQILAATQEVVSIFEEKSPRPTRSQFLYLPAPGDVSAKLYFSSQTLSESTTPGDGYALFDYADELETLREGSSQKTGFEFTTNITRHTYIQSNISFQKTKWAQTTDRSGFGRGANESSGLNDIKVRFIRVNEFDRSSLVYGLATNWSPKPARYVTASTAGNSFSGVSSLSPFIAYENSGKKGTWGAKFEHTLIETDEFYLDEPGKGDSSYSYSLFLDSFYEFPFASFVDVGVGVGMGNENNNFEGRGYLRQYNAHLYSNFHFIEDTEFQLTFGANTLEVDAPKTTTEVALSLRRTL